MTFSPFRKNNADGSPKKCKFCGENVWWHDFERRWFNVGGESLHSATCETSQMHYHEKALDSAEIKRSRRER